MAQAVTKENVEAIYPLTPLQEGMLYHHAAEPASRHYFEQTEIFIKGNFDPVLCERAWNELARRHESLRSAFEYQAAARSLHIILKERQVEFSVDDISLESEPAQLACIEKYKTADRERGFDLKHDSLLRFRLFQLSPDRYCLIWSHPHIILDGWSGSVLQSEFMTVYRALKEEHAPALPPVLPLQKYWDWRERQDAAKAKAFWNNTLESYDGPVTVPRMPNQPPAGGYQPCIETIELSAEQTRALQQCAAALHTTVNTLLQAVWAVFLRFHNNTNDVLFGIVVSNRPPELDGIEHFAGLLINTLPLRVTMDSGMPFSQLVRQIQLSSADRSSYEYLSLPEIHALSPLKNRLFDHLFVFENYPGNAADDGTSDGFIVERSQTFEYAHYNFGIVVHPAERLRIQFNYNANHYSKPEIERLRQRLQMLLQSVLRSPDTPVCELNWLPEAEIRRIEEIAGGTVTDTANESIIDWWDRQVKETPDRAAVIADAQLTYRELDEWADRLASYLINEINLSPEDRVAVILSRSHHLPVALLGVLKAGGCYLPIADIPAERIQAILEDSGASTVMVCNETVELLLSNTPQRVINILALPSGDVLPFDRKPKPTDLAYMIYTSGSTGRPKGVLIEHHSFVSMIRRQIETFGVRQSDRVMQFASFSFDASLSEIFMTLLTGAALVIAPPPVRRDAVRFLDFLKTNAITVVTLPPSFLRALEHAELSPLRVLITAGESAIPSDAAFYAGRLDYFNGYGPSECAVCATMYCVPTDCSVSDVIPIGKPLDHLRVFVLDRELNPLPAGLPGEICVAGSGLARGYHNRPDETARAFINHPRYGRMYRTGDVGIKLDDGNLLFTGRLDNQLKIRGFRVEPEEVEHSFMQVPGIRQAVVIAKTNGARTPELWGFYKSGQPLDEENVRAFLAQRIPQYMIPSHIVPLDEFPVNKNGKVDKQALKEMEDPAHPAAFAEPQTEMENVLSQAICGVLAIERVNLLDSFQSAGGDSLLAIRLHSRLRKKGFDLRIDALMQSGSLREAAAHILPLVEPKTADEIREAGCTPVQQWFFSNHKTAIQRFSHCIALKTERPVDTGTLSLAFNQLAKRHDAFRIRFRFDGGRIMQRTVAADSLNVQTETFAEPYSGDRFQRWCGVNASFDLENERLFRVFLLKWSDCEFIVMVAHHLVVDAVSWQIVIEELNEIYSAIRRKQKWKTVASTPYLQWANDLQRYAANPSIIHERSYWDSIIRQTKTEPPSNSTYGGLKQTSIQIPLERLSEFGDVKNQAFLHNLALSFTCRIIQSLTGRRENTILLSNHGRHPVLSGCDVSRTIGWFTCYYPVVMQVEAEEIGSQVEEVRKALADVPNHGMGYGLLHPASETVAVSPAYFDFLFNFIGRFQPDGEDRFFQLDEKKTRVSIDGRVEFPFKACFDVLLDPSGMTIEIAHTTTLSVSRSLLRESILVQID